MKESNGRRHTYIRHARYMDTIVTLQIVSTEDQQAELSRRADQAMQCFATVEAICSRFQPDSELRQLCSRPGEPVTVSPVLFEAVRFALRMAEETAGAFDPTVGHAMERAGFDREYVSGLRRSTFADTEIVATYKDVRLDEVHRTIKLVKPLLLDLGAVAKGLAVDLAAQSLTGFDGFAIDAGGDVFVSGSNDTGGLWRVGIRHPIQPDALIATLELTDCAICTSGTYERFDPSTPDRHHLLDPVTGESQNKLVSCTVIAPFAMLADGCSTAAFVLGPEKGIALLDRLELEGLLLPSSLVPAPTSSFARYTR